MVPKEGDFCSSKTVFEIQHHFILKAVFQRRKTKIFRAQIPHDKNISKTEIPILNNQLASPVVSNDLVLEANLPAQISKQHSALSVLQDFHQRQKSSLFKNEILPCAEKSLDLKLNSSPFKDENLQFDVDFCDTYLT